MVHFKISQHDLHSPLDAGTEDEWLGMMSSRVNISQAHVHLVSLGDGEHSGLREKCPGDLQSLEYLPPSLIE
jgi:hypothetical protein